MKEIQVSNANISKVIEAVSREIPHNGIWFRGQSNYIHKLQPAIFRENNNEFYAEDLMLKEFIRSQPGQSQHHKSTLEWLTLMQHYGIPTRLLDWTSNLLVALFFCCNNEGNQDGAIFVINPESVPSNDDAHVFIEELIKCNWEWKGIENIIKNELIADIIKQIDNTKFQCTFKINDKTLKEFNETRLNETIDNYWNGASKPDYNIEKFELVQHEIDKPHIVHCVIDLTRLIASVSPYTPPHLNPRIMQQHGFFTLHGGKKIGGNIFVKPQSIEETFGDNCVKIKISAKDKGNILKELALSGIAEHTLFPEMEKQAQHIKNRFTYKKNAQ